MPIVVGIDLDGVLAAFVEGFAKKMWPGITPEHADHVLFRTPEKAKEIYHQPGFFTDLDPFPERVDAVKALAQDHRFEVFIVTSPPSTPHGFQEKASWVAKHLGEDWIPRMITVIEKSRIKLDFLVDDRVYIHLPEYGHCSKTAPNPEWKPILSPTIQSVAYRDRFVCLEDWSNLAEFFLSH